MAYVITKKQLAVNAGLALQAQLIAGMRGMYHYNEQQLMLKANADVSGQAILACNANAIGAQWYLDRDTTTVTMMRDPDDGLTLLNDLDAISRNVDVGVLVSDYRRYGADAFEVRTSLDGNHDKPVDGGAVDYDGTIIPVHSAGISAQWREMVGERREGIDRLTLDHEQAVRAVKTRMAIMIYDGMTGLQFKGYKALGIRNSPNVLALDINTLPGSTVMNATHEQIRDAFRKAISTLHSTENGATGKVDFYVSSEIWERLGEIYTVTGVVMGTAETLLDVLKRLPDIGEIKRDTMVKGDEFVAVIRRREYIEPIVGMPVTTTPIDRKSPMDNHQSLIWSVMGIQLKADAQGRSGILYAAK